MTSVDLTSCPPQRPSGRGQGTSPPAALFPGQDHGEGGGRRVCVHVCVVGGREQTLVLPAVQEYQLSFPAYDGILPTRALPHVLHPLSAPSARVSSLPRSPQICSFLSVVPLLPAPLLRASSLSRLDNHSLLRASILAI